MTAEKRAAVRYLTSEHEMSERRSCEAVRLSRSAYRYRRKANDDGELEAALGELAARHPEMGFGKYYRMLRRAGRGWNHKRVHDSLGGMPPSEFLRTQNPENSILGWT